MFNLFRHEVTSRWTIILSWGIGLSLFASMYISVYPTMAEQMEGLAEIQFYRIMGFDLTSFAGYIASIVIQVMPIILGVYVMEASTGTLAGEEASGTLELVVAMPLKRWQIVAMKAAALAVVLFLILVILGAGSAITLSLISQTTEVDATPGQLFTALLNAYPMLLAFLAIGLFLGAFLPSRRIAVAFMVMIYLGSYLLNSISNLADSLAFLKQFSLFAYFNTTVSVFTEGNPLGNVAVLLAVALIFFGLALLAFERRSITVGQWFWRRPRVPVR